MRGRDQQLIFLGRGGARPSIRSRSRLRPGSGVLRERLETRDLDRRRERERKKLIPMPL